MTGKIEQKRIPLGDDWYYAEWAKPQAHSLHILSRYLEHSCWSPGIGFLIFGEMVCSRCHTQISTEILEKGMTLLGMRVI